MAYLQESILLFGLKLVGTKEFQTTEGLFLSKTVVVALEQLEDIVDDDCLKINFFLVVQILSFQLNLNKASKQQARNSF